MKKEQESQLDDHNADNRRTFLKKVAYVAPVIITFALELNAQAQGTRGSPPDPPRSSRVSRDGKEIIRR
ncbi:MAG: hypothetical protein JRJ87_19280 [Deltaproteobacteria bacterium]|nr:hypothetical protein [Deltaproteobacteria bacterium]